MPRPNAFDRHEEGARWKKALLTGKDPHTAQQVTQRYVAKQVGISEQAAGQLKKRFLAEIKKKAAKKLVKQKDLEEEQADLVLDELQLIQRNIRRLEKVIGPVYSAISMLLENAEPEEVLYGLNREARGHIALLRGLLVDSNKILESYLRVKEELAPEIHAEEVRKFKQQLTQINTFLFEEHPDLLDHYETWLKEQREGN